MPYRQMTTELGVAGLKLAPPLAVLGGARVVTGKDAAQKRSRAKIINNRVTQSLRVMAAGMMSHMTSKARPWFRLTTPDSAMAELTDVRLWLDDVTQAKYHRYRQQWRDGRYPSHSD